MGQRLGQRGERRFESVDEARGDWRVVPFCVACAHRAMIVRAGEESENCR